MPRCIACDLCDTVGENSPYRDSLRITRNTDKTIFMRMPDGSDYCSNCYGRYLDDFEGGEIRSMAMIHKTNMQVYQDYLNHIKLDEEPTK